MKYDAVLPDSFKEITYHGDASKIIAPDEKELEGSPISYSELFEVNEYIHENLKCSAKKICR